ERPGRQEASDLAPRERVRRPLGLDDAAGRRSGVRSAARRFGLSGSGAPRRSGGGEGRLAPKNVELVLTPSGRAAKLAPIPHLSSRRHLMAKRKSAKAKKAKKADPALRSAHQAIKKTYRRVKNKGGAGSRAKMAKLRRAYNLLGNIEL